jgi:hypothetical protein
MQGDVVSQSTGQDHLESGQLGTADVTASTVANIGPGIDLAEFTAAGLGIIGIWWVSHLVTGDTGSMDPVGLYAECSTMATIRDPVRLLPYDAVPSRVHVAPPPGLVFAPQACALTLVAAAAAIGCLVVHRNPHAGASEGAEA